MPTQTELKPFTILARIENHDMADTYHIMAKSGDMKDIEEAMTPVVIEGAIDDGLIEEDTERSVYIEYVFAGHHDNIAGFSGSISLDYDEAKAMYPNRFEDEED